MLVGHHLSTFNAFNMLVTRGEIWLMLWSN